MPGASDRRATLSDTLRGFWRGLRDYDPWKVRLVDRGRFAFSVTWSSGLSATMWIGGALLIGAAVVCLQAWSLAWFLPVIAVLAVLGVVAAWRTPTFVADPEYDVSLIMPGAIYCGDRRENSRGEDVPSDMAALSSPCSGITVPRRSPYGLRSPTARGTRLLSPRRQESSFPTTTSDGGELRGVRPSIT